MRSSAAIANASSLTEMDLAQATITQIVDEIERRDLAEEVRMMLQDRYMTRRTAWIRENEAKGYPPP